MDQVFSTVLVANRGEIACRVIATLHRLGIGSVAVHSEADAEAKHVQMADAAVCLGPAAATASYLNIDAVLQAARATGAEAVHPGYGFLAENVEFARACAEAGVTFIGPGEHALEVMGDKIRSKNHVAAAGVPLVAGVSEPGLTDEQLIEAGSAMTFPVLIKPSAGGGGKGMHVVERPDQLAAAITAARRVARSSFGDDTLLIEQLVRSPRHIEVQVLADAHGDVIHLGERECSLQRRHQKVIEEAPSALLDEATRARIGEAACAAARSVDYRGAGTVEFLVSDREPEKFYFMEMNTRLQVEHPVTEEVTGIDLVEEQIRIAAGAPLRQRQEDIVLTGHSVEARVYAEVPEAGFLPSAGTVLTLHEPAGEGIRVDSGLRSGLSVGTDYDPMLAKIIATGADRGQAFARLDRALAETVILGVATNISYLRQLVTDDDVAAGRLDTTMIERKLGSLTFPRPDDDVALAAALFTVHKRAAASGSVPTDGSDRTHAWQLDGWRPGAAAHHPSYLVTHQMPTAAQPALTLSASVDGSAQLTHLETDTWLFTSGGHSRRVVLAEEAHRPEGSDIWIRSETFTGKVTVLDSEAQTLRRLAQREAELTEAAPEVTAPLPGTVVAVEVSDGDRVRAGEPLVTLEAMKMEHRLLAPLGGTAQITVAVGDQVPLGRVLATMEAAASEEPRDNDQHDGHDDHHAEQN